VRLVDPDPGGGGFGRRRAGFLARALARSHASVSRIRIPASRGVGQSLDDMPRRVRRLLVAPGAAPQAAWVTPGALGPAGEDGGGHVPVPSGCPLRAASS
jgi:hypothetical protein